ncbi:hypothetical protein [Pseudalkalibacillus caeni]|uniref:hypothetical protein n=1 Tax=Exobacillus caeni TaxID=2574798 RepID=UPI0014857B61|nr:hypothetical protein [Pseudalkalibacillus caeni]
MVAVIISLIGFFLFMALFMVAVRRAMHADSMKLDREYLWENFDQNLDYNDHNK